MSRTTIIARADGRASRRKHRHASARRLAQGATGLMQIIPGTWVSSYGLGVNPFDPHDNTIGACQLHHTAIIRSLTSSPFPPVRANDTSSASHAGAANPRHQLGRLWMPQSHQIDGSKTANFRTQGFQ